MLNKLPAIPSANKNTFVRVYLLALPVCGGETFSYYCRSVIIAAGESGLAMTEGRIDHVYFARYV